MSIKNIIKKVSEKEIAETKKVVKAHFETGSNNSQMIMIAFD